MAWDVVRKDPARWRVTPNLADYRSACAHFSWAEARLGDVAPEVDLAHLAPEVEIREQIASRSRWTPWTCSTS